MTLLPLPPNCVALEELPTSESPQGVLMELLGSLQHPYIYPILDLGFHNTEHLHYVCLVMPFNQRGSLKDLIYKVIYLFI
jgi:PX domain-containing protein kinase-like protein